MKIENLKCGHIQIYKRENSNFWQMKLKYPKEKAIRLSTGTKILNDAKKISRDQYYKHSIFKIREDKKKKNDFKKIHLIDSKNLSKKEILYLIKESKKYISFNKLKIKKYKILFHIMNLKNIFKKFDFFAILKHSESISKNIGIGKKSLLDKFKLSITEIIFSFDIKLFIGLNTSNFILIISNKLFLLIFMCIIFTKSSIKNLTLNWTYLIL